MVFNYYNDTTLQKNYLSYDAALILVVIVLILLVASRVVVARTQRHSESARTAPIGRRIFGRFRTDPSTNEPNIGPAIDDLPNR